jgi:hypothetical protein
MKFIRVIRTIRVSIKPFLVSCFSLFVSRFVLINIIRVIRVIRVVRVSILFYHKEHKVLKNKITKAQFEEAKLC